ncbi:flavin reductase family protein [Limimaricola pyoseonensis]|uniref:NADH-FMN oxidoreductase RutF, flavin reductase (DIM6/NTAB) family n=1 Tax=Limimaricola pyoseonensis TaxID=521013 RepID=A0A1G7DD75_9RHOB|nr:flavin reductase family protein [Limimaricola pyoseonensis]SDE49507.1 NADH-FMN oxidoreductase RutF, flavin reductase (DIM6/NTAB) family [Limimaricola pyoseonensis]
MFYRPEDGHGLPHNPFNAIVSPRPIAWVSTRGSDGSENLAPYSFFNAVAYVPPQVMFASTSAKSDRDWSKDTMFNIRETEQFCVNIVEYAARDVMNVSSGPWPKEEDEFAKAGIERAECQTIACSRVANAPASLECRLVKIVELEGEHNFMAIGEVTGVHMRDDCIVEGRFDVTTFQPLARLGYRDYARVTELFSLTRPGQ